MIKEELLHFLWQHQYFNRTDLETESGVRIQIIHPGTINTHAGPDFFNGQVRIANMLWVGNIEIHIRSSDWYKHNHQIDPAYQKVILHVVWEHDKDIFLQSGELLNVLVLKGKVSRKLINSFERLQGSRNWVACQDDIANVDPLYIQQMLDRMAVERLEKKSERVEQLLKLHKNDWEKVFYQLLARAFGFKVNALPFELLAIQTELAAVRKCKSSKLKLEALFYGQAGFLDGDPKDVYQSILQKEYHYLKKMFHLKSIDPSLWKFHRMRPNNFPTIRLAQFIAIYQKYSRPFSAIQSASTVEEMRSILTFEINEYWIDHTHFGKASKQKRSLLLGERSSDILIINVVVPLLFSWQSLHQHNDSSKVLEVLERLPIETNSIISKWMSLGLKFESAFDSQAALQLKNFHCQLKKCLNCTIGNAILKTTNHDQ